MKIRYLFVLLLALSSGDGLAEMRSQTNALGVTSYMLDGKDYSKRQLSLNFVQAAFTKYLWVESFPSAFISPLCSNQKECASFDALNKWQQNDITVGIGLPPASPEIANKETKYISEQSRMNRTGQGDEALVKDVIYNLADPIKQATGLSVRFMVPSEESYEDHADVRIMFEFGHFAQNNKFKVLAATVPSEWENIGNQAVRFTPRARSEVEGYYVSEADNHIQTARCYIWPDHEKALQRGLISECLLRVLGLPEQLRANTAGLLGNWNKQHDAYSMNVLIDGLDSNPSYDQLFAEHARAMADEDTERAARLDRAMKAYNGFSYETEKSAVPKTPSDMDIMMLSLLYCEVLDARQGRHKVLKLLSEGDGCFDAPD